MNVKDQPAIVEVPAGRLVGVVDVLPSSAESLTLELPVLTKERAGKYVLLARTIRGQLPDGFRVIKTSTYRNWMFLRALVKDGDLEGAT